MPANTTAVANVLRFAAVAPGPRSATAAIRTAAAQRPVTDDVAAHLTTRTRSAMLTGAQARELWAGPRGNYTHGIAAVMLCTDRQTLTEIGEADRRKHIQAALSSRVPQRAPLVSVPATAPALVTALTRSDHFTDDLALELVGVDASLDAYLARHPDLIHRPGILRALIDKTVKGGISGVRLVTGRRDFAALAQAHPFVAEVILTQARLYHGAALAKVPDLPLEVYTALAQPQPLRGMEAPPEWAALAGNPAVPEHLFATAPVSAGGMRVLARLLGTRVGDDPTATDVALRLVLADDAAGYQLGPPRSPLTAAEVADAAAAVTAPASR